MGYDFMLLRVEPRPTSFPSSPTVSLDSSVKDIGELTVIFDAVQSAGFIPQGADGYGGHWFHRNFEDGGMLSARVQRDCVSIDTHAHWNEVGNLYRTVVAAAPDLLLFDPQKFLFHDGRSFAEFCAVSYRERAGRRPR